MCSRMQIVCAFRSAQCSQSTLFRVLSNFFFNFFRTVVSRTESTETTKNSNLYFCDELHGESNETNISKWNATTDSCCCCCCCLLPIFLFLLFILQSNEMKKNVSEKSPLNAFFRFVLWPQIKHKRFRCANSYTPNTWTGERSCTHRPEHNAAHSSMHNIFHTPNRLQTTLFYGLRAFRSFSPSNTNLCPFPWSNRKSFDGVVLK